MLALEFGDEAPDNWHMDEEARLKSELSRTPLALDLSRWILDETIRSFPYLKIAGSPTAWSLFSYSSPQS